MQTNKVQSICTQKQQNFNGAGTLTIKGKKPIDFKTTAFQDKFLTALCDEQHHGKYQFNTGVDKSTAMTLKLFFKTLFNNDMLDFKKSILMRNYLTCSKRASKQEIVSEGYNFAIKIKNRRLDK